MTTSVLNNTAGAADFAIANQVITIASDTSTVAPSIKFPNILGYKKTAAAAAVATSIYCKVIATVQNSFTYKFVLSQIIDGVEKTELIKYTSDANATYTEVTDGLKAKIDAFGFKITVTTDTITNAKDKILMVGQTGYEVFTLTKITEDAYLTKTTNAAGSTAINTYAVLSAAGVAGVESGITYTSYYFKYKTDHSINGKLTGEVLEHTLYVDDADAQYAAFDAQVTAVLKSGVVDTTAGAFLVGARYIITSVGNTDFVAIGAASDTVGVEFKATGVGAGTGTALLIVEQIAVV